MPQAATSVDAAVPPCSSQLTPSEDAAVSAEKTRNCPSRGEYEDGRSPHRSCRSQESLPDDPSNCRSPSGGPRKLLKDSSGAPHVIPRPSDGSTTGHTLGRVQRDILRMAYNRGGLKFGSFTLKSGRHSPFFFNSGCFSDGEAMELIAKAYAAKIVESGIPFDVLFGPAYKGIPLVACTASVLAREYAVPAPFAYDRKEPKDHGEGGELVGAIEAFGRKPLGSHVNGRKEDSRNEESSSGTSGDSSSSSSSRVSVTGGVDGDTGSRSNNSSSGSSSSGSSSSGSSSSGSSSSGSSSNGAETGVCGSSSSTETRPARVIVLDDVLTAGSAIRGSLAVLRKNFPDLQIPALCFLLDRQERVALEDNLTASQKLEAEMKTKVLSVLQMADIVKFLEELIAAGGAERARLEESRRNLRLYLEEFGCVSVE